MSVVDGGPVGILDVERMKWEASRAFLEELVAADHNTYILGAAADKFNKRIAEINRVYAAIID